MCSSLYIFPHSGPSLWLNVSKGQEVLSVNVEGSVILFLTNYCNLLCYSCNKGEDLKMVERDNNSKELAARVT